MSRFGAIANLLKGAGKVIGNAFRGPLPEPPPIPPALPRPAPTLPKRTQPSPRLPEPSPPEPPSPQPRRPVLPTETDPEAERQTEPELETDHRTESDKATKTEDDQQCETCPDCEPRKAGAHSENNFGNVNAAGKRGYDYQHFVCPWHPYFPEANSIGEWSWAGIDFDGLHPMECQLFEVKLGYDGFLQQKDWSPDGRPVIREWYRRVGGQAFNIMEAQARRHTRVVLPHYPKVRITWVFSSELTKLYMFQIFLNRRYVPPIDAEVRPYING